MRNAIWTLVACLLLSGVVLAGCGGGDSTMTGGNEVASKGADGKEGEAPAGSGGSSGEGEAGGGGTTGEGGPANEGSSGGSKSGDGSEASPSPGASPDGESPGAGEPSGEGESSSGANAQGEAPVSKAKATFITKANALCDKRRRKMQAKVGAILEGAQKGGSQEAVLQQMVEKAIAPGMEAEADGLRGLEAPPGDAAKVRAIAAQIEATVAELRKNLKLILSNANVFGDAQKAAREYGIGKCAQAS